MIYHLKLKTQKVQKFIFKVPKLKAMLGSNSILGEFFAVELPELRNNHEKYQTPKCWKEYCANLKEKYLPKWQNDDIYENFKKGVICSAGGHFETLFDSEKEAKKFIREVKKSANDKIPGVRLSFFLKKFTSLPQYFKKFHEHGEPVELPPKTSAIHIDNPYFYPSSQDGENPQLVNGSQPSKKEKKDKDSSTTKHIKEAGDKFYKYGSQDYLCKFIKKLIEPIKCDKKKDLFETDLNKFAKLSLIPKNNKIAIIAIDGNAMGNRFKKVMEEAKGENKDGSDGQETIPALISFEKFWFHHREVFRNALRDSITDKEDKEKLKFENYNNTGKLPFQIMMLGGDDLLLITVPEIAFDLVNDFASEIEKKSDSLTEQGKISQEITISAGIAFVNSSFPFSQGHELAESLLSSAKVKSRVWEEGKKTPKKYLNTLDWHVHFPTGTEEIDEIRQKNYMLQYNDKTEILTQRPYTIKKAYKDIWEKSENLYDSILKDEIIKDEEFENSSGRNKYKRLRTLLKKGKNNTELYAKILDIEKKYIKYDTLEFNFTENDERKSIEIDLNNALDIIELMDFHKRENKDKEADNESH